MNSIPSPQGLLFDLDGVLYVGKEIIPGAIETVAKLREHFLSLHYQHQHTLADFPAAKD